MEPLQTAEDVKATVLSLLDLFGDQCRNLSHLDLINDIARAVEKIPVEKTTVS